MREHSVRAQKFRGSSRVCAFASRDTSASRIKSRLDFNCTADKSITNPWISVKMVRQLKHHEQKLLRKVDFTNYASDANHRGAEIIRRYSLTNPNDYGSYNRLAGQLRHLAHRIALLPPESQFRRKQEDQLLEKLHDMGLLGIGGGGKGKLSDVERKVTVSAFCRRRLGVVMTRLRMSEHVSTANKFIEQGHVRVGTEVVTDPAFLVTR